MIVNFLENPVLTSRKIIEPKQIKKILDLLLKEIEKQKTKNYFFKNGVIDGLRLDYDIKRKKCQVLMKFRNKDEEYEVFAEMKGVNHE